MNLITMDKEIKQSMHEPHKMSAKDTVILKHGIMWCNVGKQLA